MDSILELDSAEVKQIKHMFQSQEGMKGTFVKYAPQLFETSFLMLLSTGAKQENF